MFRRNITHLVVGKDPSCPNCIMLRPGEEFKNGTIVGWGRKGVLEDLGFLPPEAEPVQVSTPNQQYLEMPMLSTEECLDKYFSLYQVNLTGKQNVLGFSIKDKYKIIVVHCDRCHHLLRAPVCRGSAG